MIVLDASSAIELVLNTEKGKLVAHEIASPEITIHAPHLIDLEVLQVLRRYTRSGALTEVRASLAVSDFGKLDLFRYPHEPLSPRIWALRNNLSAYDAAYVALSEALEAPLLTLDKKLSSSPGHRARIICL